MDKNNERLLVSEIFSTLLSCQQQMSYEISREMKSFNITRQQYEVLNILSKEDDKEVNLSKVKSLLRENVPDISRIVQRLVEKNLINRSRRESDKRNSAISINEEGLKVLNRIEPVIKDKMQEFFGSLSEDELKELFRIISKVNRNKG